MNNKSFILIFIIWLFCFCGIIGIISPMSNWFLNMTPLNLGITLFVVLSQIHSYETKTIFALAVTFLLGFTTEFLGVNYGIFFGEYVYGENLGIKIYGVPIIICFNWVLLTIISADTSRLFFSDKHQSILAAAVIMTLLDLLLEYSAPRFDFWSFSSEKVPLKNYLCWFFISTLAHIIYQNIEIKTNKKISYHVLASIFLFFGFFLIF